MHPLWSIMDSEPLAAAAVKFGERRARPGYSFSRPREKPKRTARVQGFVSNPARIPAFRPGSHISCLVPHMAPKGGKLNVLLSPVILILILKRPTSPPQPPNYSSVKPSQSRSKQVKPFV